MVVVVIAAVGSAVAVVVSICCGDWGESGSISMLLFPYFLFFSPLLHCSFHTSCSSAHFFIALSSISSAVQRCFSSLG
jgi:hypothetical protein